MEYRKLKLKSMSAQGLKNGYCEVSFPGCPKSKQKMFINSTKPPTNTMEFVIDEPYLTKQDLILVLELKERRFFGTDKEIGKVVLPVRQLYQARDPIQERKAKCQVMKFGVSKGLLEFAYGFGEKFSQPTFPTYAGYMPKESGTRDKKMSMARIIFNECVRGADINLSYKRRVANVY